MILSFRCARSTIGALGNMRIVSDLKVPAISSLALRELSGYVRAGKLPR